MDQTPPIIFNKYAVIKYFDTDPRLKRTGYVTTEMLSAERCALIGVYGSFQEATAVMNSTPLNRGEYIQIHSSNETGRVTNSILDTRWGL